MIAGPDGQISSAQLDGEFGVALEIDASWFATQSPTTGGRACGGLSCRQAHRLGAPVHRHVAALRSGKGRSLPLVTGLGLTAKQVAQRPVGLLAPHTARLAALVEAFSGEPGPFPRCRRWPVNIALRTVAFQRTTCGQTNQSLWKTHSSPSRQTIPSWVDPARPEGATARTNPPLGRCRASWID